MNNKKQAIEKIKNCIDLDVRPNLSVAIPCGKYLVDALNACFSFSNGKLRVKANSSNSDSDLSRATHAILKWKKGNGNLGPLLYAKMKWESDWELAENLATVLAVLCGFNSAEKAWNRALGK